MEEETINGMKLTESFEGEEDDEADSEMNQDLNSCLLYTSV